MFNFNIKISMCWLYNHHTTNRRISWKWPFLCHPRGTLWSFAVLNFGGAECRKKSLSFDRSKLILWWILIFDHPWPRPGHEWSRVWPFQRILHNRFSDYVISKPPFGGAIIKLNMFWVTNFQTRRFPFFRSKFRIFLLASERAWKMLQNE